MGRLVAYAEGQMIGATTLRVVRRLDGDRGRMAQVYLATRTAQTGASAVVVKIANVSDRHGRLHTEALHSEATNLAGLSHPHIVRLLPALDAPAEPGNYVGETQESGYAYLVLEHLMGGSLSELLQWQRVLSGSDAVAIAYALASALDYVHAHGLVHLDVAPNNVLFRTALNKSGLPDAVLIDFGSARRIGRQRFTMLETFYASTYLPPEILEAASAGFIDAQPTIDVYALGAVLYTMLVGEPPFIAKDQRALHSAIQQGAYPRLAERWRPDRNTVPAALQQRLDGLVGRAMYLEPQHRCTAAWMARELYEIGFHLGLWPVAGVKTASEKTGGPRSLLVVLMVLGLLVFGAGFGAGVLTGSVLPTATATPMPVPTAITPRTATSQPTPTDTVTPTVSPTNSATPTALATATSAARATATTRAPTPTLAFSPHQNHKDHTVQRMLTKQFAPDR